MLRGKALALARPGSTSRTSRRTQLVEQRPSLLHVTRVETFGEPAVDRREQFARFARPALRMHEPRERDRGAQLPPACALRARHFEHLAEAGLGRSSAGSAVAREQELAVALAHPRLEKAFAGGFDRRKCVVVLAAGFLPAAGSRQRVANLERWRTSPGGYRSFRSRRLLLRAARCRRRFFHVRSGARRAGPSRRRAMPGTRTSRPARSAPARIRSRARRREESSR